MSKLEQLKDLLESSLAKCYKNDRTSIESNMEQASVARIFYYMQDFINNDKRFGEFKELDLDSEYNKNGTDPKRTTSRPRGARPDVILHQRNNNKKNTLILEFKSETNNNTTNDFEKLKEFTQNGVYNYYLGAFIKLNHLSPEITYFQNGAELVTRAGAEENSR